MRVIRVARPGYNAETETDPSRFSLYSDGDNVLIKEKVRGSGEVDLGETDTIAHNLGYIPLFFVYGEVDTNIFRLVQGYPIGGEWRVSADSTNLYIYNGYSATLIRYKYFLFYDNFT